MHSPKKTILFFAANPEDTERIRFDKEIRDIYRALNNGSVTYTFIAELAVRFADIRRAMYRHRPFIVHFSGHGTDAGGIVLEDEHSNSMQVDSEHLARFFEMFQPIDCLILSSCNSQINASAFLGPARYVVGMGPNVEDKFALKFSEAFYEAIAQSINITEAYETSCISLEIEGCPQESLPVLQFYDRSVDSDHHSESKYPPVVTFDGKPSDVALASPNITENIISVIHSMFHGYDKIDINKEFSDGQSGTRVFLIAPYQKSNVRELPAVVKIGNADLIREEWEVSESYARYRLPGYVPIDGTPTYFQDKDGLHFGGVRYALSGNGLFRTESLRMYSMNATAKDVQFVLVEQLFQQLYFLWQSSLVHEIRKFQDSYDQILPINLGLDFLAWCDGPESSFAVDFFTLDANNLPEIDASLQQLEQGVTISVCNFVVTEVDTNEGSLTLNLPLTTEGRRASYRVRLYQVPDGKSFVAGQLLDPVLCRIRVTRQSILTDSAQSALRDPHNLSSHSLTLPTDPTIYLPNPLVKWTDLMVEVQTIQIGAIHGDLNMGNVLVNPDVRTTNIIDCASAREDHVLLDLLRLEMETLLHPLSAALFRAQLPPETIYTLYFWVHCATQTEPHSEGQFAMPKELDPALVTPYVMLVTIRNAAREYLATTNQWQEYYTGLALIMTGSLKFKSLDHAPMGHRPKEVAFWGAATILWLIENDVDCRAMDWELLDIVSNTSVTAHGQKALQMNNPRHSKQAQDVSPLVDVSVQDSTDPHKLHQTLLKTFDLEELRTLCFALSVEFDDLRGEGRAAKARELVRLFQRSNRLEQLAAKISSRDDRQSANKRNPLKEDTIQDIPSFFSEALPLKRFINVSFPERTIINRIAILNIQLTVSRPVRAEGIPSDIPSSRNPDAIEIDTEGQLSPIIFVKVSSEGFIADKAWRDLKIPLNSDSERVEFQLNGHKLGRHVIEVEFYHKATRVGYVVITSEIVSQTEKQNASK